MLNIQVQSFFDFIDFKLSGIKQNSWKVRNPVLVCAHDSSSFNVHFTVNTDMNFF